MRGFSQNDTYAAGSCYNLLLRIPGIPKGKILFSPICVYEN